MRVDTSPNQFAEVPSGAVPATPSCCCCCCCCLATTVSGVALNAVSAHHEARIHGGSNTAATLLSVAAVPVGAAAMVAAELAGSAVWPLFALVYLGVLLLAYRTAGSPTDRAVKRALISSVVFPVAFGLELAGGFFLVLYAFPLYLILAGVLIFTVIPAWSTRIREAADRAIAARGDLPFDPAVYDNLMPPPPTNELDAGRTPWRRPPTPPEAPSSGPAHGD